MLCAEIVDLADRLPCSDEHVCNAKLYDFLHDAHIKKQVRVIASLTLHKLETLTHFGCGEVLKIEQVLKGNASVSHSYTFC